jgi:hypothetical protein
MYHIERMADIIFVTGIFLLVVVCGILTYALI